MIMAPAISSSNCCWFSQLVVLWCRSVPTCMGLYPRTTLAKPNAGARGARYLQSALVRIRVGACRSHAYVTYWADKIKVIALIGWLRMRADCTKLEAESITQTLESFAILQPQKKRSNEGHRGWKQDSRRGGLLSMNGSIQ